MRERAEWWVLTDDMILEYLRDEGTGTPKVLSDALGKSQGHINQRSSVLADYGLVTKVARGVYQLSEVGGDYLDEELDASDLESSSGGTPARASLPRERSR